MGTYVTTQLQHYRLSTVRNIFTSGQKGARSVIIANIHILMKSIVFISDSNVFFTKVRFSWFYFQNRKWYSQKTWVTPSGKILSKNITSWKYTTITLTVSRTSAFELESNFIILIVQGKMRSTIQIVLYHHNNLLYV